MSATRSRRIAPQPQPQPQASEKASPSWIDCASKMQAFQVHAARDMLAVFNRCFGALAAARDPQSLAEAQQAVLADWTDCLDGLQRQWAELAQAMPADSLAALGWRVKPTLGTQAGTVAEAGQPNLLEQSTLGIEMLLRPWIGAPDLEHTDEFVA